MASAPLDPPQPDQPTQIRWLIFSLACATSWLLYLHRYAWGVIKPTFRKENPGFSDEQLGWLDSAFLATYALGQIPGGLAGDRFGPRATLSLLAVVWSVAAAGVAWVAGFWPLAGLRAVFGFTQAGVYPVLSKMTRTWFPPWIRTSVQGVVTALGRLGGACAPLIIATLFMGLLGLSWQTALLLLVFPGLALAVVFWLVARDSPREHPWMNAAEKELLDVGIQSSPPGQRPRLQLKGGAGLSLAMMLLYAFASTFQDQFYVFWIPFFLKDARQLDDTMMGLFAPLPLLGGALGGILGGILNDVLIRWWGGRRWARRVVAFSGKFLAAGFVLLSFQVADGRLAMLVLLVARVFSDWSLPTQWAAITDMGGRASATLFGLVNTVGALAGFVANPVFGILKEHFGWQGVFLGVSVMCLVAAGSWLFIDCTQQVVSD